MTLRSLPARSATAAVLAVCATLGFAGAAQADDGFQFSTDQTASSSGQQSQGDSDFEFNVGGSAGSDFVFAG